ncbi:SPOR domain-containing protein [uncultured Treponema sp.]|uniref:SPOR domain-containing protein n=1 Tax=Treponema sp. TaxID=166 RepID=UPI0025E152E3|nr:SPOR domain-containing protein [uncultured Treponema sp.]MEE0353058.1 SPOR domain-containing protein [Treponema sp.]
MKKLLLAFFVCVSSVSLFAQNKKSAEIIKREALKQETVLDSIDYLKRNLDFADTAADTRSLLYYTGTLQEQLGLYTDAGNSYAKAAGIAAHDASNMPKVTSEQLVLNAVRANLCAGNWETADSYLNSAVRNSKNETVSATVKLYSVWSDLCKASSVPGADISDSVELLKAYSSMQSMKSVKAQVLFTLWHLTSARVYAEELNREFPLSPESSVANGKSQIMRVPFWYFVPKENSASSSQNRYAENSEVPAKESSVQSEIPLSQKHPGKKQQLGLFKKKENADDCIRKAKQKGFDAYCYTETRSSGTTYFIVAVDENSSMTMGQKLKNAGIDCYTIE